VFNGLPHLTQLVDSILAQTHEHLDVVFVDGGSSDNSLTFLRSVTDPRVRVLTNPTATGAGANWDAASESARGEFVKLICQDDLLYPEAIAKQVADLSESPTAVMAIAQRDIVDARGSVVYRNRGCAGLRPGVVDGSDAIKVAYLRGTNVFGEPVTVLFRRQSLMNALSWDDSNPFLLDLTLYAKVARTGDVVVRKESIGAFRVSTQSWSTRLVGEQVRQFRTWQESFAASLPAPPGPRDRGRAFVGLHTQALLRRGAYRWLRIKGSLESRSV
jgi:glycosyltransferase involved in cell wall biosynthesis